MCFSPACSYLINIWNWAAVANYRGKKMHAEIDSAFACKQKKPRKPERERKRQKRFTKHM